ncbi:YIP1 family protein [Lysobacter sp. A3-1-A15]|uniref:YIP1 family protein n=1 Tax=Novilysobacter viscosus TaxID=3098602 RepID=UPI002EDADBED
MDTTLSPAQALVTIFTEPRRVFDTIPRRSMAYLPLLLALAGHVAIWVWYYQVVDIAWLQDRLISQHAGLTDSASRQAAASVLSRGGLLTMSVSSALLVTPLLLLVLAAYFFLAGRALGQGRPYRQWFGFVAWGTAPALLLVPVMALQILLNSNGQISPEALNPLSLNSLVFGLEAVSPWHGILSSLNLTTLWTIGLLAFGLHVWTGRSWAQAVPAAVLPFAAVYAAWALKIATGA